MTQTVAETMDQPRQLTLFDLEALEAKITAGMAAFMEVGNALAEIQQAEGWKMRGFKSMEEYCEKQFGFSLRHGQRQIAAAQTATAVKQITGEAPRNEAAAREIGKVAFSPAKVKKVEAELKRQGKTIATATAEVIAKVVTNVLTGKTAPKAQPEAKAAPVVEDIPETEMPTLQDFCPSCGELPGSYTRRPDGWHCPQCDAHVMLGVVLAEG